MKFYLQMPKRLKGHFQKEIDLATKTWHEQRYRKSWSHLERAHILGQQYPWQHSIAHWEMFLFACRTKNTIEVLGQISRLAFGGVKSFVGKIPRGNSGGANVPALKSFPIDSDLEQLLSGNFLNKNNYKK